MAGKGCQFFASVRASACRAGRSWSCSPPAASASPIAGGEVAHVGDVVVTRRNDRHLTTTNREPVRDRETCTISDIAPDGALTVIRQYGTGSVTLSIDYIREYVRFGYAATEHGWQADTVVAAISLATAATTCRGLYVAATRGRERNEVCVVTESDDLAEAPRHPRQHRRPRPRRQPRHHPTPNTRTTAPAHRRRRSPAASGAATIAHQTSRCRRDGPVIAGRRDRHSTGSPRSGGRGHRDVGVRHVDSPPPAAAADANEHIEAARSP